MKRPLRAVRGRNYQRYQKRRQRQVRVSILAVAFLLLLGVCGFGVFQGVRYFTRPTSVDPLSVERVLVHHFPFLQSDSMLYFDQTASFQSPGSLRGKLLPIVTRQEDSALKASLQAMLAAYPSQFVPHLFYFNPQDGSYVEIDGYKDVPAASVIKLPVLLAYFTALDRDILKWDTPLLYLEFHRSGGAGELQYGPADQLLPSREVARQMIQISDNTATNILISYLGGSQALNRQFRELGLRQTIIRNWLPDLSGTNTISMYEMATLLHNIDQGPLLSRQSRLQALEILKGTHNRRLLAAPLPEGTAFAHKTGDIGTALGDAGTVYMPDGRRYIIAMQVDRPYNDYTAREMFQQASRIIYNHVLSQPHPVRITRADEASKNQGSRVQVPPPDPEVLPVDGAPSI